MESNQRYYARRAAEELRAAARAVTPEARARRRALAESFARKAGLVESVELNPMEWPVNAVGLEAATY